MLDARYQTHAVRLLQELIRNACVNTGDPGSGNEIASVRTIQDYLGHTGTVVEPIAGRASVVFRLRGHDTDAPRLLLIPHLDVVPADPTAWTHDPFSGDIRDGFVWGRGAVDMLNVTAAMVAVFKALLDGAITAPAGDVILAAVADEEAGGTYGARYLVDDCWELVSCDYVLTEVAGPMLTGPQGSSLPVTVAEKGPAWRSVTAHGVAGHGSQPFGRQNAVVDLASAFSRIAASPHPVLITPEWCRFVPHLPMGDRLGSMLILPDQVDLAIEEIATTDVTLARWIHACTHLTFSPNVISGGTKANVVPSLSRGDIDIRLLPGQDAHDVADHLRKVLGPDAFEALDFEPVLDMEANGTHPSGALWESIADAAELHIGTRRLAPTLTPVTTDARFFRSKGIPAFGVGLFDDSVTFPEMLAMFHGADERVSVGSVELTAAFLGTVIETFSARVRDV